MSETAVLVTGCGRCGTTLMMRMLHLGGMQVFADNHASYEFQEFAGPRSLLPYFDRMKGRATKILDPHRWGSNHFEATTGRPPMKAIWLSRDSREQAKSQIKLMREFHGWSIPGSAKGRLAKSIVSDTRTAWRLFEECDISFIEMRFENILLNPSRNAEKVAEFLSPEFTLDAGKMAGAVLTRTVKCLPDLSIEYEASLRNEQKQLHASI